MPIELARVSPFSLPEILQSLWKWFTQMNPSKDGVALFGLKVLPIAMLLILAPAQIFAQVHETSLEFPGGYPTAGTAQRFYDMPI